MATTTEQTYGDWQDGGSHALGQYWYRETPHADDCGNEYGDCTCGSLAQSVFEDVQDTFDNPDAPHQFYAWNGRWSDHDYNGNGMTGLYPSRDEAAAALP